MRRFALAAAFAALPVSYPLAAQDAGSRAAHSFLIDGAPGAGLFWRHSAATDLGVFLTGSVQSRDEFNARSVGIMPTLVRYHETDDRFAPYTLVALGFDYRRQSNESPPVETTYRSFGPRFQIGLGLEWFPLERISVGGHAGLDVIYRHTTRDVEGVGGVGGEGSDDEWSAGVFTSGLRPKIHF